MQIDLRLSSRSSASPVAIDETRRVGRGQVVAFLSYLRSTAVSSNVSMPAMSTCTSNTSPAG